MRSLNEAGVTVVLTTHYLEEAEELVSCRLNTHVARMDNNSNNNA